MKRNHLIIPTLIAALFALPANSEVMKLKNAVETAVISNPEVLKIYNTYESTYAEELAAIGSGFLPSVDYTYQTFDETRSDPLTLSGNGERNYNRINRGISIRQNLFNGFFDYNNVKRLSHAARGKIFELENTSSLVATDTTKAYVDLVRYRLLVSLAENNYVSLKTLYGQLKLKVDAGVAKKSDLEQAQSRLSLADYNLTVEGANLHDMEAKYQRLVGDLPPKDLDNTILINKDIPKDAITALTKAQQNNPALVASFEDIEQQTNMRNTKASAFMPRVDLRAFKDSNINTNGVAAIPSTGVGNGQFRNEGVGIEFSWNLFRGGADINNVRKEQSLYEAALDNRDKICRDVREQLQIGYNDIKKYTEQVAFLDQRQIAIEKARDAYRKQFEINQRSLIDLLNAENELFEARRAFLNASHDLAIAYARTHAQMGTILQALGISRYKSDKVQSPMDTKVDVGYASCPTAAPTPYVPDRRMLDQRANDAMVPVSANGNVNTLQDANDKKKTPQKKEKDLVPPAQPVTTVDPSILPIETVKATLSETAPKTKEVIQVANNGTNTGSDLTSPEKIKSFQKSQGIPVTGKLNRVTREALKRLKESTNTANESNTETTQVSDSQLNITSGDQNEIQKISKDETASEEKVGLFGKLGNLVRSFTAPAKTETLNPKTPDLATSEPAQSTSSEQAEKIEPNAVAIEKITSTNVFSDPDLSTPEKVKEFQKSQGIPMTGFVGDKTRKALKRIQQAAGNSPVSSIDEMSPPITIGSN